MKYQKVLEALAAMRREYTLDQGVVQIAVRLDNLDIPQVAAYFYDQHNKWAPLENLSPRAIAKYVEIKAMVDDWVAGKLEALPPSTSTRIAEMHAEWRRREGLEP